jgi:hypothetical protein
MFQPAPPVSSSRGTPAWTALTRTQRADGPPAGAAPQAAPAAGQGQMGLDHARLRPESTAVTRQ